MRIELAATQAVRNDQLGLTLRDRMWLARVALATIALSAIAFPVLLTMMPAEAPAPLGALETRLAARESLPIHPAAPAEPLALPEVQRAAPFVALEPEPAAPAPAATAPVAKPPAPAPVQVLKATRRGVVVSRGKSTRVEAFSAPAVDLSRPQLLAPARVSEPQPEPEPIKASPLPEEPGLKRPALD